MKLVLKLDMPQPQPEHSEKPKPEMNLEDKVRRALELIDTGYCSNVEWIMVNKLYKQLKGLKKKSPRAINLIKLIEPALAKYGYHKVSSED